ncbi:hypothetical protein BU14_0914s0003 [Porphyra umbilicalis]|uniref:Uncharacterized protein n=1 Tax=Porphyra umbilicalis TaxID=2786 RepID=A0A1X6NND3_PORUM|nr:hypothetical protein BU14_0914s0003 [Porphyra umbilicalis]|eukprot:OSX70098.1 hypothetical protein BU14_0914s0003 [Porphyra umbilicalis]
MLDSLLAATCGSPWTPAPEPARAVAGATPARMPPCRRLARLTHG